MGIKSTVTIILFVIIRTHFLSFCIYMCILIMSDGVSYCPHVFEDELYVFEFKDKNFYGSGL